MATLEQSFLNMMDLYKNTTTTGAVADVMEVLNDLSQDVMSDWTMMECNQGTNHLHSIRTGLPSVAWGALYEGIPQSRSQTQQVTDTTGFAEALCSVDKRVLDLYADKQAIIRSRESATFMEAMAQEAVKALFYHNSNTNARLPHGLSARYAAYAATPTASAGAANQVIPGGGSGSDNTSIWFVTWGGHGTNIIYPKGTSAGIVQEDKGEQMVNDGANNPYFVMMELIKMHMGVTVGDWRRNCRIANIDVSNMQAGSVDLYALLRKGYYRTHGLRKSGKSIRNDTMPGRTVIYCNRDVLEALDGLATNTGSGDNFVRLRPMELEGKEVLSYRGIPIRETDALINAEALVPAA